MAEAALAIPYALMCGDAGQPQCFDLVMRIDRIDQAGQALEVTGRIADYDLSIGERLTYRLINRDGHHDIDGVVASKKRMGGKKHRLLLLPSRA